MGRYSAEAAAFASAVSKIISMLSSLESRAASINSELSNNNGDVISGEAANQVGGVEASVSSLTSGLNGMVNSVIAKAAEIDRRIEEEERLARLAAEKEKARERNNKNRENKNA